MLVDDIKSVLVSLRKSKSDEVGFISFVISEIENIGKNNGNRKTTDDEAIKIIKKIIDKNKENIKLANNVEKHQSEINLLEQWLPETIGDEEILNFIKENGITDKKTLATKLKTMYGASVDMKQAMAILEQTNVG